MTLRIGDLDFIGLIVKCNNKATKKQPLFTQDKSGNYLQNYLDRALHLAGCPRQKRLSGMAESKKRKVPPHPQITTWKKVARQPQSLLCYHEPSHAWSLCSSSYVLPDQPAPLNPEPVTSYFIILI